MPRLRALALVPLVPLALLTPAGAKGAEDRPAVAASDANAPAFDLAIGGGGVSASLNPFGALIDDCECERPTDRVGLRGGYAQIEAQAKLGSWLAGAVFLRPGAFSWSGAVKTPSPLAAYEPTSALDPQLGNARRDLAFGAMVRLLPGRTAIDLGFSYAFGSMQSRDLRDLALTGSNTGDDQAAFAGRGFSPTVRLSYQAETGYFLGVGWGEGFVRMPQPGGQLVVGYRDADYEAIGGVAKLYDVWAVGRLGGRLYERVWVTLDVMAADFDCGYAASSCGPSLAASASIAWRGLGLAL